MYLMKTNRTDRSVEELGEINENASPDNPLCEGFDVREYEYLKGYYTIFHDVADWRKFNALHGWFVDNVQGGTDDCGYYRVTKDHLSNLLGVLQEVYEKRDPSKFPPVGGFFFGSTETDDWYWEDIEDTIPKIQNILEDFDWDKYDLFYHSSW